MKDIGRTFFGSRYVAPMAAAMRTDSYSLQHWVRGKGPTNLPDRLARLIDSLIVKHVDLAARALEWKLRLTQQSDIVTLSLADRLRDIRRELEAGNLKGKPAADVADAGPVYIVECDYQCNTNQTIDELCDGFPEWRQQQLRELYARPD
jgi:hypothetical protein